MTRGSKARWLPLAALGLALAVAEGAAAQGMQPTTLRGGNEGDGPHDRLIIRGATVIDGTGAPPQGPMDIVIENNRIVEVRSVGYPHVPINESRRPQGATREIDAHGMYVLPGFIDNHVHTGGAGKADQAEYVYKLWLAHGITATRGVAHGDYEWSLREKAASERNEIVAPRLYAYHRPGSGAGWTGGPLNDPETAREWVRWAANYTVDGVGIDGLKMGSYDPEIMEALIDEAIKHNLGTTAHLGQMGVARMNADRAAQLGLGSITHFYGLFESLLKDRSIQYFPEDQNYNDEQHRFGQVARLADQSYDRGDPQWDELIQRWVELDFIINPTMVIYSAGRDVMRERAAEWHREYSLPSLLDFFEPSREAHGSYWFDWTSEDEVEWRKFYRKWGRFLNDYKNAGGRVTIGTDCGFIYQLYGFCYVTEMELFQEAGFHPLEVIRSATLHAAEEIFDPKGTPVEFGIIRPGLLADLVILDQNPLQNFKHMYGNGHVKINDETGQIERVRSIRWTIKDGIVYDVEQLLEDVREMVERQKEQRRSITMGHDEMPAWVAAARR